MRPSRTLNHLYRLALRRELASCARRLTALINDSWKIMKPCDHLPVFAGLWHNAAFAPT